MNQKQECVTAGWNQTWRTGVRVGSWSMGRPGAFVSWRPARWASPPRTGLSSRTTLCRAPPATAPLWWNNGSATGCDESSSAAEKKATNEGGRYRRKTLFSFFFFFQQGNYALEGFGLPSLCHRTDSQSGALTGQTCVQTHLPALVCSSVVRVVLCNVIVDSV